MMNKPRIVIAGGTGFLGQALTRHYLAEGCRVTILTRQAPPSESSPLLRYRQWDGRTLDSWTSDVEGADVLINLCGASVNCRYHAANRQRILDSRLAPTRVLSDAVARCAKPPSTWINASTATIYRHAVETYQDEQDGELGDGFSERVAKDWEAAFFARDLPRTRRVALRAALVLGHGRNSAYPPLARLARWGLGGHQGAGAQMVSWIHIDDFVRAVSFIAEQEELSGPVNLTAPAPVSNRLFMATLRRSLARRWGLPSPAPLLRFGTWLLRTEAELVLKSRNVVPRKLLEHRFLFRFPFLDEALDQLAKAKGEADLQPDRSAAATAPRPHQGQEDSSASGLGRAAEF